MWREKPVEKTNAVKRETAERLNIKNGDVDTGQHAVDGGVVEQKI